MLTLVLDTETTDLVHNPLSEMKRQPHIAEFNGQLVDDAGKVVDELYFLCKPGKPMEPDAARITGITDEMVKDRPPFEHYAEALANLIARGDAVVAHNLDFDYRVLCVEFERAGRHAVWPKRKICTVMETEWILGRRLKMHELYKHLFDVEMTGSHRAKGDVNALVEIYNEMRKRKWL